MLNISLLQKNIIDETNKNIFDLIEIQSDLTFIEEP